MKIFDLTKIASTHGTFKIKLSLNSALALDGTNPISAVNGVAEFTNIKITSKGIFYILADESHLVQAKSEELIIGIYILRSQIISISPSSISKCEQFSVNVRHMIKIIYLKPLKFLF